MNITELKTYLIENGFVVFRNATGPVDVIDGHTLTMATVGAAPDEFVDMLHKSNSKMFLFTASPRKEQSDLRGGSK